MINKTTNKKGASLSGFTEGAIGVLLILFIFGLVIIPSMNYKYGKNFDGTLGITTNDTQKELENYQGTLQTGLEGEASENALGGIWVLKSWGIIKAGITMVINFLTGGFIVNAISLLGFGQAGIYLGWAFRLLFIFALGFILIKILFKIKP